MILTLNVCYRLKLGCVILTLNVRVQAEVRLRHSHLERPYTGGLLVPVLYVRGVEQPGPGSLVEGGREDKAAGHQDPEGRIQGIVNV